MSKKCFLKRIQREAEEKEHRTFAEVVANINVYDKEESEEDRNDRNREEMEEETYNPGINIYRFFLQ